MDRDKYNNLIGTSLLMVGAYYFYKKETKDKVVVSDIKRRFKNVKFKESDKLILTNHDSFFRDILTYLFDNYPDKIHNFTYCEEKVYNYTEYRARRRENPSVLKIKYPLNDKFTISHYYNNVDYDLDIIIEPKCDKDGNVLKLAGTHEEREQFIQVITVSSNNNKDVLLDFAETARKYVKGMRNELTKTSNNSMLIYYYKGDYWSLLSKIPKRKSDTVYLKEGLLDKIYKTVGDFLDEDTRDKYLHYGIPYKNVHLIYGPPGTGKTSLIRSICSNFDCDLFVLPIQKNTMDLNLIDAMSGVNNMDGRENKNKIIVMEDIDTIFDERKSGDADNGITLQCLLNMLDGFTTVEGTLIFLTANKPELFDQALMRSGRIDHKINLDYADKYQVENMFMNYLPGQTDNFEKFYKTIRHLKITTAILQEFLFKNIDCKNILDHVNDINMIVENNDSKNFEVIDESKNLYS